MAAKTKKTLAKKTPAKARPAAKLDEEIEESFPASDPPSFVPGHVGAPAPTGKLPAKAKKKPRKA